ncbi:MAG TPA: aminotransferase class V-fold PLP-dependent enzyme [Candidatus Limnocylindria bacterium]|nr:aminotransferase class V-fold PLP-dependent enzyme [Candidatus Limnocylindria bacterium]
MIDEDTRRTPDRRIAALDLDPETFRALGHRVVDRMAALLAELPRGPVTPGATPAQVRSALGQGDLPERGADPGTLLDRAADLLARYSLFNGHPRFFGYITSSAAPIGALADLIAATVNPNLGGWELSPVASEIEAQTNRWIAELIGYPRDCGGVLVSGGNMANFVGFLAARQAKAPWDVRAHGPVDPEGKRLLVYASAETHTWIQKAADLFGLGTDCIRWIETDDRQRMNVDALEAAIAMDHAAGARPFLVVGTAGSVSTGAVDPLLAIAAICHEHNLWFHVDGAYGALAAALPDVPADLKGLSLADSVAVDPHKWLYAPIEAGCALVRDPAHLRAAFSYRPPYYLFGEEETERGINYYEYGPQNTRGFRALKVWLVLQHAGRSGIARMIADDIRLATALFEAAAAHPELEAFGHGLSIATFRYVPRDLRNAEPAVEEYLDRLNAEINLKVKHGGRAFLSNAVVRGRFLQRACIVNFRTQLSDVEAVPGIVAEVGREVDATLRPQELRSRR